MQNTFRLEFNEQQQHFHHNHGRHEPDTFGWVTIFEHCTDLEFYIFESFVNRIPNKKLTVEYLLQCASELPKFISNLLEYKLSIVKL